MKKCGGTCPHRLQIEGAECPYSTNMNYIAEIRLHFQTNYVALRLWDVFSIYSDVCTILYMYCRSNSYHHSLVSAPARQTSVSSKETLIASFQTCQSNPQEITPSSGQCLLHLVTTYNIGGRRQDTVSIMWPCARYRAFLLHGKTIQKGLQRPLLGKPNHP